MSSLRVLYHQMWSSEMENLLPSLQEKSVDLLGDGRCDSPGHSAKYLTYSFMDAATKKIISCVQVQVGEVSASSTLANVSL